MDSFWIFTLCMIAILYPRVIQGITTDYLNTACNASSKAFSTSLRLESNTRLHYSANTACSYHVIAPTGQQVLLLLRIFKLEAEVSGVCVDFVNIHDGSDTTATTLNTSPLCGTNVPDNFTSTGNEMTIYFQSDSTGQAQGFDFIFVAFTTGSCSSAQFSCVNTSICIDSSLQCDTVDECGDEWDEHNCVFATRTQVDTESNAGLIAGGIIGGFIFLVVCIAVGSKLWKYYRWRLFQAKPIKAPKIQFEPTTYNTTYPITRVYYKEKFHDWYQDPRKVETKAGTINQDTTASGSDPRESTSGIGHVVSSSGPSSASATDRNGVQNLGYDSLSD